VCTANQCRSPLAGALLRRALDGSGITVLDAGTGEGGFPATDDTVAAAARLDLDLTDHVSTTIDPSMIEAADVVLTMERAQVRAIVLEHPEAWSKTFTLKEFVRRADEVGARTSDVPLDEWLDTLHEGRNRVDLLGTSPLDDVPDPTSDRRVDHDSVAEEL